MKRPDSSSSLSPTDAAFLYLERKEMPMHIASVCIFDGAIPFREFVASISSKLHLIPRYRQIAVDPPWSLGLPSWEDDVHFDIRKHIFPIRLIPEGGEAELQELAGRIFSQPLDRTKPLWDMHVVEGLKEGHGAIILRVHHALADGASGAELMKTMLDVTPEPIRSPHKTRYRPRRPKSRDGSLADGIFSAVNNTLGSLVALEGGLLDFAKTFLYEKKQGDIKGLVDSLPEFAASVERLPFNKPCTGGRKFCWMECTLEDVQAIRASAGGTVNDVILAVLTRALAKYVKLHGQSVDNRFVRIVCPVSLRQKEQKDGLGNQISFLPVSLPMDARGPIRMLQAVAMRTERLKRSGAAGIVGLAARWLAAAPAPLQALFWRAIPNVILPVPLFNMICTNVVGSPTPLYAEGRRMIAAYPQVPTGYDLGVGCAVHSYDGKLFFGFIADTEAAPDVERLRDFVALSFQELRRSVTSKRARGREKPKRAEQVQEQKAADPVPSGARESAKGEAPVAATVGQTVEHAKEAA